MGFLPSSEFSTFQCSRGAVFGRVETLQVVSGALVCLATH